MSAYGQGKKEDPQADLIALNRMIAEKDFSVLHLLCGEESYLRLQKRDDLLDAMGAKGNSLSFARFAGTATSPREVIDLAETLPFMAERRVILIEDSGWFKDGCPEIEEYIESGICPSTSLVFNERNVDKRIRITMLAKKHGVISDLKTPEESALKQWVGAYLAKTGIRISANTAEYLIRTVGSDMMNLANEMDKLSAYCASKGYAESTDVDAICSRRIEDRIFDMCKEIAMGHKRNAFAMYSDLRELRVKAPKIMALVIQHFDILLKIRDIDERGANRYSDADVAELIGRGRNFAWTIKKYRAELRGLNKSKLARILELCADMDRLFKTGRMDEDIAVEMLMVKLLEGDLLPAGQG